jgi:uncharacterized membrane protein YozB (DUF420 family)
VIPLSALPTVNACLNAASGILLLAGYRFIRRRAIPQHRACMIAASSVSLVFLASYITYHAQAGSTPFEKTGWIRPTYFAILISHAVLAAVTLPLAIVTLLRGLRGDLARHRRIARWTFPIWIYVSATGVIVYLMLYHL